MTNRTVLISGSGIAGSTLAYWLARRGFQPTVVERAQAQRSSGSPVDVRGPAVVVAERMGVMRQLREAATEAESMAFIRGDGREVGRVDLRAMQQSGPDKEVELPRGELAKILYESSRDTAEFIFGDSIAGLQEDSDGVEVSFDRGDPRRFDLVVGADGLHSATRRLTFGEDVEFVRHMGLYVATMPLGHAAEDPSVVLMYNTPGKAISIHPSRGSALAAFIFRSPARSDFDHRDIDQHRRWLVDAYAGAGWRVPELLDRVRKVPDLFFDSVSQVRLPQWSRGRVSLIGDAAACVSLFGDGSSMAMAGAAVLADSLAASPGDHRAAFREYQTRHAAFVDPKQRNVQQAARLLVPATPGGIVARNLATRLWPVAGAAQRIMRRLSSTEPSDVGHAAESQARRVRS
jgi:2-polyprenyl-6-methoxyphenol hydroxylase-like FAD-dependent oxidoreductase